MKRILLMALAVAAAGCTDADASRVAAQKAGFTDVRAGGYAWFKCGGDDTYATRFEGVNPAGARVEGAVCCALLKGCTVRF